MRVLEERRLAKEIESSLNKLADLDPQNFLKFKGVRFEELPMNEKGTLFNILNGNNGGLTSYLNLGASKKLRYERFNDILTKYTIFREGRTPPMPKKWGILSSEEKEAANVLGFKEETWNIFIDMVNSKEINLDQLVGKFVVFQESKKEAASILCKEALPGVDSRNLLNAIIRRMTVQVSLYTPDEDVERVESLAADYEDEDEDEGSGDW